MELIETKICKKCGVEKPITDFTFDITLDGRRKQRWQCKECRTKYAVELYHKKRDKICPICGESKQPCRFVRDNSLDFKVYGKICKECAFRKNIIERERSINNKPRKAYKTPKEVREYIRNRSLKTYRETKRWLIGLKDDKCAVCGQSFPWYVYDFHHKNNKGKENKISQYTKLTRGHLQNLSEFWEEFDRCILVCVICHRKLHVNGGEINFGENEKKY